MMVVHVHLKNTSQFILKNIIHMGIMKHMYDGKYRKIIFLHDEEFGTLVYPLAEIAEMYTEDL